MAQFVHHRTFPANASGWYVHYEHLPPPSSAWRDCDARAIVDAHLDEWIDAFDSWHAELCRRGQALSSVWWLSPASRPNVWAQSASLKPLFMAAATREWALQHPEVDTIHVIAAPPEVAAYLIEFEEGVTDSHTSAWTGIRSGLRSFARQAWNLLPYCWSRPPVKQAATLFYSHLFFPAHGVGDHFFGPMIQRAAALRPGEVQVACYLDGNATTKEARALLQKRPVTSWLLLDCLTFTDVAQIVASAASFLFRSLHLSAQLPPVRLGAHASRRFAAGYIAQQLLARPPVMEVAIHVAFRRAIKLSGAHTVIYPYEEKGLERGLLAACRAEANGATTIGYVHAAQTKAHLAMRSRPVTLASPPAPDVITTAGPFTSRFLIEWGRKPADRVTDLGSHRFRTPFFGRHDIEQRRGRLRIVMLTGHGFELSVLANLVEKNPGVFDRDDVVIRRTGGGWFEAQDAGIRRLTAVSDRITIGSGSLLEQLEWCDVALFSSTTAGIEAMLAGRLSIYLSLHDVFEADPTNGDSAVFARCRNEHELDEALKTARRMSDEEYAAAAAKQVELASRILAPVDEAVLTEAISA